VLDDRAVVYDLRQRVGQRQALLFVVRTQRAANVRDITPLRPTQGTRGWSIGVWRGEKLLYVLAVEGNRQRYRSFIKRPPRLAFSPVPSSRDCLTVKV
jgi:hypothetical protein